MPRAIWSGSISFGLVNVPVKVFSAVSQKDLHFNQFEEGTKSRIRYKRVNEKTGKEVPFEKIVKGYELGKGRYVMLTSEELENFAPEKTRTIDIEDFVDLDDIDPIYFEHTYYLAPDGKGSDKAYALLLEAMEKSGKVGIGRVVMRTKQYLTAIRPLDGVLAMSTMLYGDEVVDRKDIDALPSGKGKVTDKEVKLAQQIIDSLSTEWKPAKYKDTYRDSVLDLIHRKADGEEIVAEESTTEAPKVLDLMAALEASLKEAKGGRAGATKKAAAKKSAAKKSGTRKKAAARKSTVRKSA